MSCNCQKPLSSYEGERLYDLLSLVEEKPNTLEEAAESIKYLKEVLSEVIGNIKDW